MVTGASSGIGQAYADRLATDGYDLLGELAARLQATHGVSVQAVRADLADAADVQRICDEIDAAELDLLVNNAALAHYRPFADLPAPQAQELVHLNVLAPVLLTRRAVTGMLARQRGSIINVASLLAFSGPVDAPQLPQRAVYAATKSFLVTFSEVLAREVGASGVRVQVVCPGLVRTEFHSRQGLDMSAVPRMEPEDVVEASLADLANGVVVSIPGLDDLESYAHLEAADHELLAVTRATELPDRYRRP
jgi:short-subunit dehydrogenase